MNLTPEQKAVGQDNYYEAVGVHRRDFLKGVAAATAVSGTGFGAMYFGYQGKIADPVRVGVIGTGDEGNVLIGAMTPEYVTVRAICDIRPYSIHRAFHGEWGSSSPVTRAARKGLMAVYDWKSEDEARRHVTVYSDYKELLKDPDIEGVIIALPLHLHHPVAMDAMLAGKHVLTEKLMAHNVAQCKEMARLSEKQGLLLATGHQRHYNVLYENAKHLLKWGIFGQIHSIRAQWHRGNLPGGDSWKQPLPGGEVDMQGKKIDRLEKDLANRKKQFEAFAKSPGDPNDRELLRKQIAELEAFISDQKVDAEKYDYQTITLANGRVRSALEELVRWRLWDRTSGGLMAELGSHQLDAASIFVSALRDDGKKAHPLTVHALGGRHVFPLDRDCEDHVYCMFEFPAPGYAAPQTPEQARKEFGYYDPITGVPDLQRGILPYQEDENKKIVVTYSSINGNGFGGYGELVMGSKGSLVLEREQEIMLYKDSDTETRVKVSDDKGGPALDTQASGGPSRAATVARAAEGPPSRGYREEIEHWAWCIRHRDPANQPRCRPEVAMGDAIIALTTNVAIKKAQRGEPGFVRFDEAWFDPHNDATPDGSVPKSV